MADLKNLLEGISFPVANDKLGEVCKLLSQRLRDHKECYEIEREQALAALHALQRRCKHPGATYYSDPRDGGGMNPCPVCGASN